MNSWGGGGEDEHSHGATGWGQPLGQEAKDGGRAVHKQTLVHKITSVPVFLYGADT